MRFMSADQRRTRLGRRHALAPGHHAGTVEQAARAVVGLHSSDPASVFLSVWARVPGVERDDMEQALYQARSLVRVLGMRRTMFVVPRDSAPLLDAGCAGPISQRERRRLEGYLTDAGITTEPGPWLRRVEEATLAALETRGEAAATELTEDVPELGEKIRLGEGKKWGGEVGVSTRILFLLAGEGRIVRARPRGTWVSSQYRWARMEDWLGEQLDLPQIDEARAELVRLYLRRFGPATETDVVWWTGWTKTATREALHGAGVVEVGVDGGTAMVLAGDEDEPGDTEPWVALLPALDSTIMGWKERDWYLGPHAHHIFDRNGNAGPTVWAGGRVVGAWAQSGDGRVVYRLVGEVDAASAGQIAAKADELTHWLEGTVVSARFPSRLHRELAGR